MRSKYTLIAALIVLVILNLPCSKGASEWQGTIVVEDGETVIKNPKEPIYPDKTIVFEEDLSIGVEEGDENYLFHYPTDIDSDSQGNIYVLDYGACIIKKYDPEGKHIKDIGRRGQGPGEFQRPVRFCLSETETIYVEDLQIESIHVFNQDGIYLKSIHFPNLSRFSITKNEEIIIGYHAYIPGGNEELKHEYKVSKYSPQKKEVIEFYSQEQPWPSQLTGDDITFLSPYLVRWVLDSADNIYIGTANRYEVKVFSIEPILLFKLTMDVDPIPITGEAEKKLSEMLMRYKDFTDTNKAKKTLEFFPLFYSFSLDEKDRLWIERYPPLWKDGSKTESLFDVFSSEGKFLFLATINKNISSQLIFKNGYAYSLITEESGYSRAVKFMIREHK